MTVILLCDSCYEEVTDLLADCEDGCCQPLDHTGTCEGDPDEGDTCHRCGEVDRLHEVDPDDLEVNG